MSQTNLPSQKKWNGMRDGLLCTTSKTNRKVVRKYFD